MAQVLDGSLEVSGFEHQSPYYIHFRTNTPGEVLNPVFPSATG